MTEIKEMNIDQIEERMNQIDEELETAEDLDALKEEVRMLKERRNEIKAEAEKAKEERMKAVDEGVTVKSFEEEGKENRAMDMKEIRSTKEYADAYAEYLRADDTTSLNKILTINGQGNTGDGYVEIPTIVENIIQTAWENDEIFSRVRRTYAKGNLAVGFELSSTGAGIHAEGDKKPAPESLQFGSVQLVARSVKKWLLMSDELYDMRGDEFLAYIFDEITYKIIQFCKEYITNIIKNAPATSTEEAVGVPSVEAEAKPSAIIQALGLLSDEATNPVAVMNKQTWAQIRLEALNNNYAIDPFDGIDVAFDNSLPAYGTASAEAMYMYVADLGRGITANFPNGDTVDLKFDDLSLAESDLIKIVGRLYVAIGLTAPGMAVKVTKPTA